MNYFWLYVNAPFAAYREFQAGSYISAFPVMPPSAAYGLVLNLAGIDLGKQGRGKISSTPCERLPVLRIAVGKLSRPLKGSMLQQLHSYGTGTDEKTRRLAKQCKGSKYLISLVRREFLVGYEGIIGIGSADVSFRDQIGRGLRGELSIERYGLPFAGDSNFLFDRIEILDDPPAQTVWYKQVTSASDVLHAKETCRLTININRSDSSKTTSAVYAPSIESSVLPEKVWAWVHDLS